MGKYKQGILGSFTGKVGTVVGSSWRGIPVMRAKAVNPKNPRTAAQVETRNRMAATVRAIRPFLESIRHGYIAPSGTSAWCEAVKANRKKTTKTVGDDFTLKPADIELTDGTELFEATLTLSGANLTVEWDAPTPYDAMYGGSVYVAVLNATTGRALNFSADASAGETTLSVAAIKAGADTDELHAYVFAATKETASMMTHKEL